LDAKLMDSARVHVLVKEAYLDTLNTFRMLVRIAPTELAILNPVIAPLMNVVVASGRIDSFGLRAVAREYVSIGESKMLYKHLRVRLVKNGDPNKTSITKRMASWVVNTFVIKSENRHRTGLVYFERDRERSFFNYVWKMTFSGMATSVGAKKNKRYMKRYLNEVKERDLPPVRFEISDPAITLPESQSSR
jgi:hypothetical protein